MSRTATYKSLKAIRRKMISGQPKQAAVIETIYENMRRKHPVDVELTPGLQKRLKRKAYPFGFGTPIEKFYDKTLNAFHRVRKRKLVASVFGSNGERAGFVIVQPELLGSSRGVRQYLNGLGCKVVYSTHKTLSKSQVYQLFGYKQMQKYPDFFVMANIFMNNPIRVFVFKHPSNQTYFDRSGFLKYLRANNPTKHARLIERLAAGSPQATFSKLIKGSHDKPEPGTMRTEFTLPMLQELGLTSRTPTAQGRKLDMFNALSAFPNVGALAIFGGIHSPKAVEFEREAVGLFSVPELIKLKKALE